MNTRQQILSICNTHYTFKTTSENSSLLSPLSLPSLSVGGKPRPVGSYGSVKISQTAGGLNNRKAYSADKYNSRCDVKSENDVDNGGMMSRFCHECGTKYPVDWAKFCCECGVRRMCI